jgi:aldehyde dehydrogenase (NAD+)
MSSTPRLKDYWKNYIAGEWCDGGAGRLTIDNPATGEAIAEHALADNADVVRAVVAAMAFHESGVLSSMRPIERGRIVRMV